MHRHRHRTRLAVTALATLAMLVTAGCGGDDDGPAEASAGTIVVVTMVDNGFEPAELTVAQGETVTFRFTNEGKVTHEAFVGDAEDQAEHEKDVSSGEMHHGDENEGAVEVKAGKTGTMTHTFDEVGPIQIGCHEPGHYAAGMKIDVTVE
jgi:uncharacterized cupredoxin-like copper-binding protein